MAKDPRPYVAESRVLTVLAPAFRREVEGIITDLEAEGFDPFVFETARTAERQWWIYGKGRTATLCTAAGVPEKYAWASGERATNAASHLKSVHGHLLAVDILSKSRLWGAPEPFWKALARSAVKRKLTWGGSWKNPVDVPHVQWPLARGGVIYAGPSARDIERTATDGPEATWTFYQAAA